MEDETSQSKETAQRGKRRPAAEKSSPDGRRNGHGPGSPEGTFIGRERKEPKLVPLERIRAAREMILTALKGPLEDLRAMSLRLRKEYPGRTPGDVQDAFRRLRDDRRELKGKHRTLTEEEVAILRAGYAVGATGARAARKEVLRRRPDLNRGHIDRIVRQLGLGNHCAPAEPWSHEDHGYLMLWSEEKNVKAFVKRFGRTERAIRARLSRYGASARVRARRGYTLREAAVLLGVSRTAILNWIEEGRLNAEYGSKPRAITEGALRSFCKRHPEKVARRLCSPKVLRWLPAAEPAMPVNGRQGHLAHAHTCPTCGQKIRGNGYFTHMKFCGPEAEPSSVSV